jgi:hypothetical protein
VLVLVLPNWRLQPPARRRHSSCRRLRRQASRRRRPRLKRVRWATGCGTSLLCAGGGTAVRLTALVLACVLVAPAASALLVFRDTFTYPDGTFPSEWVWTGDSQGDGHFLVSDGTFTHTDGGYVYYTRYAAPGWEPSDGWFDFDVKDSDWEFAWAIWGTPTSGTCCRLSHNDAWGQWGYTVTESEWTTTPGSPDGQYMFHNGTDVTTRHYWTGPLIGWHHVEIWEIFMDVEILVDGQPIFWFDHSIMYLYGRIGIGASNGSGMGTPAFDNICYYSYSDPVGAMSWGRIKVLFR